MDYSYSIRWGQRFESAVDRLERLMQNQQKLFVNFSLDAQFELSKLSQITSVLDYQIEFEKLSSKATETPESVLISLFSGLKPEIRWELQLNRPSALKEAFASARYHESRLEDLKLAMNVVDNESKLVVNEVDNMPTRFELGVDATEVDGESNRSTSDTKILIEECDFELSKSVVGDSVMQLGDIKEEIMRPSVIDLYIVDTTMMDSFVDISPTTNLSDKGRKEDGRVWMLGEFSEIVVFINEDGVMRVAKSSNMIQEKSPIARRIVVFKLYELKEVYQEQLDFHLEDKVDLKEWGTIRS